MSQPQLRVSGLQVHFRTPEGIVPAVDSISFSVRRGETLGVVGESGCGKSVTALSIMRLLPGPPAAVSAGEIWFAGEDLLTKTEAEMRRIRGNQIAMIFQEPMTSLNPVLSVGDQIAEAIMTHRGLRRRDALAAAEEMLALAGIADAARRLRQYPHQMSGGMRQRVVIAMALACRPQLLIADEPTTALDATIQAGILDLLKELRSRFGMSILLITHDLGVIAEMADRVVVMYAGKVVEQAAAAALFTQPCHPYTEGLLKSALRLDRPRRGRLQAIRGTVPRPLELPSGCRFHPRCLYAVERCRLDEPPLSEVMPGRLTACWRWDQIGDRDQGAVS